MDRIFELVSKAYTTNELDALVNGQKNYGLQTPYMCPVKELPTDWQKLLIEGIYPFYMNSDKQIKNKMEKMLLSNMDSILGLYCTINLFFRQIMNESFGNSPFIMDKEAIIHDIPIKIKMFKSDLKKDFRWMGEHLAQGLYDEIQRMISILNTDFKVKLSNTLDN